MNKAMQNKSPYTIMDNQIGHPEEWQISQKNISPLQNKTISELAEEGLFIYPTSFTEDYKKEEILKFKKIEDLESGKSSGFYVYSGNIMGFIGIDEGKHIDIKISSRFDTGGHDYFLYYMLMRASGLTLFDMKTTADYSNKVLSLLILLFPKSLKDAIRQGLYRRYIHVESNDMRIKGKIDVPRHIKENLPFKGTVSYTYSDHSGDNDITELVRHCIEYIRKTEEGRRILNVDNDTRKAVQFIINNTPSYDPTKRQVILNKNMKTAIHPYYSGYRELQKLCIAILKNKRFAYGSKGDGRISGILFHGDMLWEDYIASVIGSQNLKHCTRKNSQYYLLSTGYGEDRTEFQKIVPDFVREGDTPIIGDAKYMRLYNRQQLYGSQTASVYYKTIMYMLRFNSDHGLILYPFPPDGNKNNPSEKEENVENADIETEYVEPEAPQENFEIIDTNKIIHKIGLVVPSYNKDDDFNSFADKMKRAEDDFRQKVETILKEA